MIAAMVFAQLCGAATPGGVVVTEGRGGYGAVIAAHAGGVVVGWQETGPRPTRGAEGPPGWRPRLSYARVLDPATLVPRGAADNFAGEEVFYAHSTGLAAAGAPGGDGAAIAHCQCFGGTGRIVCERQPFGDFPAVAAARAGAGCSGGVALGTAGAGAVLAFTDGAELRLVGSRSGRVHGTADGATADRMALARADGERAVLAWRSADGGGGAAGALSVRAMTVDGDARPGSRPVTLTATPGRVGAPAVTWVGGAALVAYAQASSARAPWQLALATWAPGRRPAVAALGTGRASATAPSIVPARGAGCAVLSWTEGSGRRTVVRAGRVCNGVLDASTVAQVSGVGVEAGESELATDGRHVYVVWQEIPAARGAGEELRVARLGCE